MSRNDQSIFDADYDAVEPSKDFGAAKAGIYTLMADDIEVDYDEKDRLLAVVRHSFAEPEGVEIIRPEGVTGEVMLGGVFERVWLHTIKALGFLRAFVEGHGGDWKAFTEGIKAGKGRDPKDVFTELLSQFEKTPAQAKVRLVTRHWETGEILDSPKNELAKYIVAKTTV